MKSFFLLLFLSVFFLTPRQSHSQELLPTDVTILTQKDFTAKNIFSVGDALRGVPSLKLEQDGSRGTRIRPKMRGLSDSDNVLVLIDGRPLTHEFDADVDLAQIPIGMVDRIEVTRGGSALSYGSEAVGGTINIVTIRPDRKGLAADLGTGVGRFGEKNSIGKIRGRSNLADLTYAPSVESSGGFQDNEDFHTTNHFANITRSFNGRGYWGAEYLFHDSRVGVSNGTPVPFEQWNGHLEKKSNDQTAQRTQEMQNIKAFVARPLPFGGTTYATVGQSWRLSDDRATRGGVSLRHEKGKTTDLDLSWRGKKVETGFQSKHMERDLFADGPHEAFQNGAYITGKWQLKKLIFSEGLRLDHHSKSGSFLSPRVAAIYSAGSTFLVSATVQRSHRVPNFDELFLSSATIGNSSLHDEKSVSRDAGFNWTPAEWFGLKCTGFVVTKKELIHQGLTGQFENGGKERSKGVETELSLTVGKSPDHKIDITGNWTAQKARRSLPTAPDYSDSAMSPRHLAFVRLDKHLPRAMVWSNEFRYQSKQFELDNRAGAVIPGSCVWNSRFSLRILAADMYFAVDNVARRRYAEASAQSPLPDRTFWTGASIRFLN